jgi:hypothetical protein
MEGPVHKRAALTEEGYFVGVQHPMALVLRKHDMKLLSVSTKKIKVYESAYCVPLMDKVSEDHMHAEVKACQPTINDRSNDRFRHIVTPKVNNIDFTPIDHYTRSLAMIVGKFYATIITCSF